MDDVWDDTGEPQVPFDDLCDALRRNDPACTHVRLVRDFGGIVPEQYGPQLGEALRGNTHVVKMELHLGDLLEEKEDDDDSDCVAEESGDLVLDFLKSSLSLRDVTLQCSSREDYGRREIPDHEKRLVHNVVMALAENPHGPIDIFFDHVDFEQTCQYGEPVDVPLDTLSKALRVTKSIASIVLRLGDGGTPGIYYEDNDNDERIDVNDDASIDTSNDEYEGQAADKAVARADLALAFGDNCSLNHIEILGLSCQRTVNAVLRVGLRRNGTILSSNFATFSDAQEKFLKKYLIRNRGIQKLLKELPQKCTTRREVIGSNDKANEDSVAAASPDACGAAASDAPAWLRVVPSVLAVVLHSPRMAGSRMLQGLLAMTEEVGQVSDTGTGSSTTATTGSTKRPAAFRATSTANDDIKRPAKKRK
jgi:hypothetical protein